MPIVTIKESPLIEGASPVEIHFRDLGKGRPLVFLHGGWGYEVYPFDVQIEALSDRCRIVIPDRSGYGRSMQIRNLASDFHSRAAVETKMVLDELGIERPILWGHSDGAVIAAMMAFNEPDRFAGIILEAFHYYRVKPGSEGFFETMARDPESLGERACAALARDHGEDYWKEILLLNGAAWLRLNRESRHEKEDIYGGRLSELKLPVLFIHGAQDPRTEPDEL
ncbi:MAG TPA: alpha/beta fold hydrolase, partial [Blastocatellia bacterium]|nr:alpha/beta fold hydrolase [Blastocatellia bacterium]